MLEHCVQAGAPGAKGACLRRGRREGTGAHGAHQPAAHTPLLPRLGQGGSATLRDAASRHAAVASSRAVGRGHRGTADSAKCGNGPGCGSSMREKP